MSCIRSVGPAAVLLLAGTLALAACNSGSGTSQRASGGGNTVTGAETPTAGAKAPGKGTLAEGLTSRVKGQ